MTLLHQPVFSDQGILKCQCGPNLVLGRHMRSPNHRFGNPPMRFRPDLWAQRFHKDECSGSGGYFRDAHLVNLNSERSESHETERGATRDGSLVIRVAA